MFQLLIRNHKNSYKYSSFATVKNDSEFLLLHYVCCWRKFSRWSTIQYFRACSAHEEESGQSGMEHWSRLWWETLRSFVAHTKMKRNSNTIRSILETSWEKSLNIQHDDLHILVVDSSLDLLRWTFLAPHKRNICAPRFCDSKFFCVQLTRVNICAIDNFDGQRCLIWNFVSFLTFSGPAKYWCNCCLDSLNEFSNVCGSGDNSKLNWCLLIIISRSDLINGSALINEHTFSRQSVNKSQSLLIFRWLKMLEDESKVECSYYRQLIKNAIKINEALPRAPASEIHSSSPYKVVNELQLNRSRQIICVAFYDNFDSFDDSQFSRAAKLSRYL